MSREKDGPFGGKEMFIFDGEKLAEHDDVVRAQTVAECQKREEGAREILRRAVWRSALEEVANHIKMLPNYSIASKSEAAAEVLLFAEQLPWEKK